MPKGSRVKFFNATEQLLENDPEKARELLRARLATVYENLLPDELEQKVTWLLERIVQSPQLVGYDNPEALCDESLPQIYRISVCNGLRVNERADVLLTGIVSDELKQAITDRLISEAALDEGLENAQRQIIVPIEEWKAFASEVASEVDFDLAKTAAWLFFVLNAPALIVQFYEIVFAASMQAGIRSVANAPRNLEHDPKFAREAEGLIKDGLHALIKNFEDTIRGMLDVKEKGAWPKSVPPEGSSLAITVETILMQMTKRNSVDGSIIFPRTTKIVAELNLRPELLENKRKVLKGGTKRRKFTVKNLYRQLELDGSPMSAIKERVKANFA